MRVISTQCHIFADRCDFSVNPGLSVPVFMGPGKEVFVESFPGENFGRKDRCRLTGETFPNLFDNGLPGLGGQFPTAAPAVLSADFAEQ